MELIPGSLVRVFWDTLWSLIPVQSLGGLGCFVVVLAVSTLMVVMYRLGLRRFVVAFLVSTWIAIAVSVLIIVLGG